MDLFNIYFLVLGAYAVVYIALFLVPLLGAGAELRPQNSLTQLARLLRSEAKDAEEARVRSLAVSGDGSLESVAPPRVPSPGPTDLFAESARLTVTSQEASAALLEANLPIDEETADALLDVLEARDIVGPPDDSGVRAVLVRDVSELEGLFPGVVSSSPSSPLGSGADLDGGGGGERREDEANGQPVQTAQAMAMERLTGHRALVAKYPSKLVQDAVDLVRVQYPAGPYQKVDVERLPTYQVYAERMGSARTMAGLFVLLGLVLTMMKLNGVVGAIADATSTSMSQEEFLRAMSEIMGGVGGAFLSSIGGLWLMLAALAALAVVDTLAQRYTSAVDRAFAGFVIPELASLHQSLNPDLSLSDLLSKTGSHLQGLNTTVDGLTDGLARSLADLGDQIKGMLQDFGRFERQYVKLDGLLGSIRQAGQDLQKVTGGLEGATRRLSDPLDEFNRNVSGHLELVRTHLETVGEATAANIEGYRETSDQLQTVQVHSDETVQAIQNLLATKVDGVERRQLELVKAIQSQSSATQREIAKLGEAIAASNRKSGPRALPAPVIGHNGSELPPTLFLWVAGGVIRLYNRLRDLRRTA